MFTELVAKSKSFDQVALFRIRKAIRPKLEQQARDEIRSEIHDKISFEKYEDSLRETARLLEENRNIYNRKHHIYQKDKQIHTSPDENY